MKLRFTLSQQTAARHLELDCTIYIEVCVEDVTQPYQTAEWQHYTSYYSCIVFLLLWNQTLFVPQDKGGWSIKIWQTLICLEYITVGSLEGKKKKKVFLSPHTTLGDTSLRESWKQD